MMRVIESYSRPLSAADTSHSENTTHRTGELLLRNPVSPVESTSVYFKRSILQQEHQYEYTSMQSALPLATRTLNIEIEMLKQKQNDEESKTKSHEKSRERNHSTCAKALVRPLKDAQQIRQISLNSATSQSTFSAGPNLRLVRVLMKILMCEDPCEDA